MTGGTAAVAPVCRVCGTDIGETPRLCPKCETPHHSDCWSYAGGCAVYACGGGEVSVEVAAPAPVVPSGIVPVAGGGGDERWIADEHGAWAGARNAKIACAEGERVVSLPLAEASRLVDHARHATIPAPAIAALIAAGALLALTGGPIGMLLLLTGGALCVRAVMLRALRLVRGLDAVWLVRGAEGLRLRTRSGDEVREIALDRTLVPRAVLLERSFQDSAREPGRTMLTFDLFLAFAREHAMGESRRVRLTPPLQMPDRADERRPLLEQLSARRALGRHVASLLQLPFHEGVGA